MDSTGNHGNDPKDQIGDTDPANRQSDTIEQHSPRRAAQQRMRVVDGVCVVTPEPDQDGALDTCELALVRATVEDCLAAPPSSVVVLNLARVHFLSEEALALLLVLLRELRERAARFALATISAPVRQKLIRTGALSLFPVYEDVPAAQDEMREQ